MSQSWMTHWPKWMIQEWFVHALFAPVSQFTVTQRGPWMTHEWFAQKESFMNSSEWLMSKKSYHIIYIYSLSVFFSYLVPCVCPTLGTCLKISTYTWLICFWPSKTQKLKSVTHRTMNDSFSEFSQHEWFIHWLMTAFVLRWMTHESVKSDSLEIWMIRSFWMIRSWVDHKSGRGILLIHYLTGVNLR